MASPYTSIDVDEPSLPALSLSAARLLVSRLPRPAAPPSAKGKERAWSNPIPPAVESALQEELQRAQFEKDALVDQLKRAIDELDAPLKPEGRMAPEDKRLAILEQELAFLEASLQAIQSPNPEAVEFKASLALISLEAESKLSDLVSEMEQAVVWESAQGARERKGLVRDTTLLHDAETLNEDLSKRVDDMRSARDDLTSEEIIARARAKSAKVAASFSGLMMALIQFIDERLAGLAESQDVDEDEGSKKNPGNIISFLSTPRATAPQRSLQLKQILENLMNTTATNPGDPYISIAGAPVELVNFLHQSGIIVPDRKDDKRVKLVDFSARLGG